MKGSTSREGVNVNMAAIAAPFQITMDMGHKLLASMEQKAKAALKVKKAEKKESISGNKNERKGPTEEELMKSIPNEYYQEKFDPVLATLQQLPADVDTKHIDRLLGERERVLDVVNSKLFGRVMSSYSAFVQGMTQIHELGLDLQQSTIMCKNGRRNLTTVSDELTLGGLFILSNFRRRQILTQMMKDLQGIKSISTLRQQLTLMMNQGDYTKAIQVCLQALNTAKQCGHFSVVKELDFILQDTYTIVQERLDKALFESCRNFNPVTYERVLQAYRLLGTTARIGDKLQPFFVGPIETETKNIILAHALLAPRNISRAEQLKNFKFKELCSVLSDEHYVNCLLTVLENLCDVMSSHYAMEKWHQDHNTSENKWFSDIQIGLNKDLKTTIWETMQRKVSDLMSSVQLMSFKVDDFLKVVEGVTLFLDVGNDFSGITAPNLRSTLNIQSKSFLENFHKQRVEDLRTMLENEMWARCPVTPNFSVGDVSEFRAPLTAPLFSTGLLGADKRFSGIKQNGNPFSKMIQYAKKFPDSAQKIEAPTEDDEERSELLVDFVDEDGDNPLSPVTQARKVTEESLRGSGPLLASTTINAVRILGKYMNMLRVLHQHMAFEIFVGITHIYEYYLNAIFSFFGIIPNIPGVKTEDITQTLAISTQRMLHRLKEKYSPVNVMIPDKELLSKITNVPSSVTSLVTSTVTSAVTSAVTSVTSAATNSSSSSSTTANIVDEVLKVKWIGAKLSPAISADLVSSKAGYGLSTRAVGIESLLFMQEALNEAKPLLISLLPPTGVELLSKFYKNEVEIIPGLRTYMYKMVCSAFINAEPVVKNIENTKWDVVTVPVNSSPYVDMLLTEFKKFGQRVDGVVALPPKVRGAVWEAAIVRVVDQLVEAYSRIKKCTNEGRAILLQDLKAIQNGIAQIAPLRGGKVPGIPTAENYITAFYLPVDTDLVEWFKEHPEYLLRHVLALTKVNPTAASAKRAHVQQALEDIDRARRGKQHM